MVLDYETGKILENFEARILALEAKLAPKPKNKDESDELAEQPLGRSRQAQNLHRERRIKRRMERMKYDDLPDEDAVELSSDEEVSTEDDTEEIEEDIEVLDK